MAIAANTKVLTLDYWKRAEHLKPGDWVFDKEGQPVQIKSIQHFYSEDCYAVIFNDSHYVIGDDYLSFWLENTQYRKQLIRCKMKTIRGFRRPLRKYSVKTLRQSNLRNSKNRSEYSLPSNKPLEFPMQDLPVPPFIFGLWYSARIKDKIFSIRDEFKDEVYKKFKDLGYKVEELYSPKKNTTKFRETPNIERQLISNIPSRIPTNYILSSIEQRVELLSGLIYARRAQYNEKTDSFRITSRDPDFILQVQCIAESLGCRTSVMFSKHREHYHINFKSKHKLIHNQNSRPLKVHYSRRMIVEVRKVQPQMVVHIETHGEDSSVAVAEGFISIC